MKILGIDNLTVDDVRNEVSHGARFVVYEYAISVIVVSFKNRGEIQFLRQGESGISHALPYSLISFFFGWWGIPWGPIYTIMALVTNFGGGKNVTAEVLSAIGADSPTPPPLPNRNPPPLA